MVDRKEVKALLEVVLIEWQLARVSIEVTLPEGHDLFEPLDIFRVGDEPYSARECTLLPDRTMRVNDLLVDEEKSDLENGVVVIRTFTPEQLATYRHELSEA